MQRTQCPVRCAFILLATVLALCWLQVPSFSMPVPYFSQTDKNWVNDKMGNSGLTVGYYGCTMTCTAMVLSFYGANTNPHSLNAWLSAHGGYDSQGLLGWRVAKNYPGSNVASFQQQNGQTSAANCQLLNSELSAGHPVIVQIQGSAKYYPWHWVVVTGKNGNEYQINDPVSKSITSLSSYNNTIYSAAVFRGDAPAPPAPATGLVSLYRYSNYLGRGDRFYTTNFNELGNGGFSGWVYEGVQCYVYASQVSGTVPLYRYISPSLGLHFFTIQNADLTHLGYYQEGIACYVYGNSICYTDPNIVPLYRYFNTRSGAHFYTTNRAELGGGGGDWKNEGIECNVRR